MYLFFFFDDIIVVSECKVQNKVKLKVEVGSYQGSLQDLFKTLKDPEGF